jgi:hypothetical protein
VVGRSKKSPSQPLRFRRRSDAELQRPSNTNVSFFGVNLPADDQPAFQQDWHQEVTATVHTLEKNQRENDPWPQAIIFVTNRKTSPWPSQIVAGKSSVLLTAINHPLFMTEENRQAAEQTYPEIGALFWAANELSAPPSHFFAQ